MKQSKILYSLLAMLVVLSLLVACAPPAATEEPMEEATEVMVEEPTEEVVEEPTEEEMPMMDLSGVEVVFWHAMSSGANLEGIQALVAEFNETNEYGITVTEVAQGSQGDLETAFNGAIATGELPTMTMGFPNGLARWYQLGVVRGLNDLIDSSDYGLSDDVKAGLFAGTYSAGTLADGTQVGVAMHQSAGTIFYNYTWAQELGFDAAPTTPAEFREQACAAAAFNNSDDNPDNDGTGGYVYFPDASMISPWIWGFGGSLLSADGSAYELNGEAALATAEFFKDLYDSGCTLSTPSFPNPEFAARLALFATSSTAGIPFQASAMADAGNEDAWGPIAYPSLDGTPIINSFGQMIGVIQTNEETDLASWLFLKWLTSPETQAAWIATTGYYPSQDGVDLGTRATDDPIWGQGYDLLQYGLSEPNLPAHGAVRGEIRNAYFAILDAADSAGLQTILDELNATAATLVAESQ
jgi:multiple sugar transport system substrate-binding protein/sn-glycerol 3-phosphate transport system substrate-binding protein